MFAVASTSDMEKLNNLNPASRRTDTLTAFANNKIIFIRQMNQSYV